jgi:hypothetical protein
MTNAAGQIWPHLQTDDGPPRQQQRAQTLATLFPRPQIAQLSTAPAPIRGRRSASSTYRPRTPFHSMRGPRTYWRRCTPQRVTQRNKTRHPTSTISDLKEGVTENGN